MLIKNKGNKMENIYKKIMEETKKNNSYKFEIKGEKFKTFIDWENDFCLTHYSENYTTKQNAWAVNDIEGLKYRINILTK